MSRKTRYCRGIAVEQVDPVRTVNLEVNQAWKHHGLRKDAVGVFWNAGANCRDRLAFDIQLAGDEVLVSCNYAPCSNDHWCLPTMRAPAIIRVQDSGPCRALLWLGNFLNAPADKAKRAW
jgi:hypothetical protein